MREAELRKGEEMDRTEQRESRGGRTEGYRVDRVKVWVSLGFLAAARYSKRIADTR